MGYITQDGNGDGDRNGGGSSHAVTVSASRHPTPPHIITSICGCVPLTASLSAEGDSDSKTPQDAQRETLRRFRSNRG